MVARAIRGLGRSRRRRDRLAFGDRRSRRSREWVLHPRLARLRRARIRDSADSGLVRLGGLGGGTPALPFSAPPPSGPALHACPLPRRLQSMPTACYGDTDGSPVMETPR